MYAKIIENVDPYPVVKTEEETATICHTETTFIYRNLIT